MHRTTRKWPWTLWVQKYLIQLFGGTLDPKFQFCFALRAAIFEYRQFCDKCTERPKITWDNPRSWVAPVCPITTPDSHISILLVLRPTVSAAFCDSYRCTAWPQNGHEHYKVKHICVLVPPWVLNFTLFGSMITHYQDICNLSFFSISHDAKFQLFFNVEMSGSNFVRTVTRNNVKFQSYFLLVTFERTVTGNMQTTFLWTRIITRGTHVSLKYGPIQVLFLTENYESQITI